MAGGCASTPERLQGDFADVAPGTADSADIGAKVRWGGRILSVAPEEARTCLQVLALPLDRRGRPDSDGEPGKRFLACRDEFIDPAGLPVDRHVTVTGSLRDFEHRAVGDYDYRFPLVAADTIHLWREPRPVHRDDAYYGYYGYPGFFRPPGYYTPFHDPIRPYRRFRH